MIDEEKPIPYHLQVKEILKKEILDDKYAEKIPSERELMERFKVSRTTIREAVNHLVNEGLLEKLHGKGTFIKKHRPIQDWLHSLNSLTDTFKRFGMKPGSKLLLFKRVSEPEHVAKHLQEKTFYVIKRLRTADGIPIAIERHYVPIGLGERLNEFDLDSITIYDVMENELGIRMDEAEQVIRCQKIDDDDAMHLEIETGTNVLSVERIIRDPQGEMIEYYTSVIKPGMYEFRIKMKRR